MISRLGSVLSRVFARVMPDPFVLAVLLTVLTLVLALTLGGFPATPQDTSPIRSLMDSWRSEKGLWTFLAFSMQMCLVLVTGHALAASRPVHTLLQRLANLARSTASAAALTALAGCVCSLLNWGLGLMVGAILAREVGRSLHRRGIDHHYPLIVAAGFVGFLPWHGGLSGSAPLSMTSAAGMAKVLPAGTVEMLQRAGHGAGVPLSETIFSPMNLVATLGLLIIAPVLLALMSPRIGGGGEPMLSMGRACPRLAAESDGRVALDVDASVHAGIGPRLDRMWAVNALLATGLIAAAAVYLLAPGTTGPLARAQRIGLNEINLLTLAVGLVLHRSPRAYAEAIEDGARGCAGIILQFPIYGGIVSMLTVSGLDQQIAGAFTRLADERTLPLLTFLCAGVINMFVPSGGGQWGVQGPMALESGLAMGVEPGKMVMAVAYGDQVTNMLQVFWALPLLAVCGVRARDIVGYTTLVMIAALLWIGAILWIM
jgi:short-chain fatty acids transporter